MTQFPPSVTRDGLLFTVVGGGGGKPFHHEAQGVLTRIAVWAMMDCVTRVELWFADGSSKGIGADPGGICETMDFKVGEHIRELVQWKGPWKRHSDYGLAMLLTRIEFITSRNRAFVVGAGDDSERCVVNVGSGLIVGATGRNGSMVDSLGFIFLDEIQSIEMELDEESIQAPAEHITEDEQEIANNTDSEVTHELQFQWTERKTVSVHVPGCNVVCEGWTRAIQVRPQQVNPVLAGFISGEQVLSGRETVTELKQSHKMTITVPPRSKRLIYYRDATKTSSTYCSGRWYVHTVSGTRTVPFKGHFSTTKTTRQISMKAQSNWYRMGIPHPI